MSITSTTCPDEGALRAWLDREKRMPGLDGHIETCATCQERLTELRADAAFASDAVQGISASELPSGDEIAMARERLAWRQRRPAAAAQVAASDKVPALLARLSTPWRVGASGLAAALVLSLLVAFSPEGRTAAAALLAQFRSQQVAAIEVSPQSQTEILRAMRNLGNLGTVTTPYGGAPRLSEAKTSTVAEAAKQLNVAIQTPDPKTLPVGVDRTPKVEVMPANEFRFRFEKAKAASYLRSTGNANVVLPDKFDGATLVVSLPAGALLQYSSPDTRQAVMIAQAGEVVVDVQGNVSLDEMRDFLLGLPGMPKETTDQLRQIRNWNQTLPVPIPTDQFHWKSETFNGAPGLLLNDNTGVGSAAVWQSGGHLHAVVGTLKATDVKKIAESLH